MFCALRKIDKLSSPLSSQGDLSDMLVLCHADELFSCKTKILSIIRAPTKSVFGIHDPKGLSHLTQLRVGLSKLNFHKFQHNFRDTINAMCPSNECIENTEHFLLLCPSFGVQRTDLLAGIYTLVRPYGYANLANDVLLQILLCGDKNFPNNLNRSILELTIRFIHSTGPRE